MRVAGLTFVAAVAVAAIANPAGAAPFAPSPAPQASNIIEVSGGCGWAGHRNHRGHCMPNRYGYYRPHHYWGPAWPGYSGGGYEPWNRPSPTDHVANQLNRQELRRPYWGY